MSPPHHERDSSLDPVGVLRARDAKRWVFGTLRHLFSYQIHVPAWLAVVVVLALLALAAWCLYLDTRIEALERMERRLQELNPEYAGD